MNGIKQLGLFLTGLLAEYSGMLLLAVVAFLAVCIIQYISTAIFGQGEFTGGNSGYDRVLKLFN
ncbi:MAG: hypothetical protein ACOY4I_14565 [Bacillota bacterium]